jgi:hypothetical protein
MRPLLMHATLHPLARVCNRNGVHLREVFMTIIDIETSKTHPLHALASF